jgi:hypothetical protein
LNDELFEVYYSSVLWLGFLFKLGKKAFSYEELYDEF